MSGLAVRAEFLEELGTRASATPDEPALLAPARAPLSCSQLWRATTEIADILTDAGIRQGDVVAAALPDGPEFFAVFLGTTRVAAFMPVNPALHPSEIDVQLSAVRTSALIVNSFDSPIAELARARGMCLLEIRRGELRADRPYHPPTSSVAADTVLLLQTSATTGKPKSVPISAANLSAMVRNTGRSLELTAQDRFLSLMPLFHLQGLLSSLTQILYGGAVISTAGFDPASFLSWIIEYRPTWYTAGPALHRSIAALLKQRREAASLGLRFVRCIGAPMSAELIAEVEDALGAPVLEGYGLTEAGAVTSNPLPPRPRKPGSAGRSTGAEVGILDADGNILSPGLQGEIAVRGACVTTGYPHDPEANRRAFSNGWLRTGDLGRIDADGYLFVTGRIKEIINRGGEKIIPQEIDNVLTAHPAVADAAAFAIPHPSLTEDVAAAVVLREDGAVSEGELRTFVASRLAAFKVPRRIFFLHAIPKSATGKPRRLLLAEEARAPFAPASTPLETRLAEIWSRILKVEPISIDDDFYTIGGDSLAATVMILEVERVIGRAVHADTFFATPTIRVLARVLGRAANTNPSLITLQEGGARAPFFCVAGAREDHYSLRPLAESMGDDRPFYVLRDQRNPQARGVYTVELVADRFLASVRQVRPHGPYFLGGHCYGGIVAFEIAQRLAAQGEEVPLVVLLDTPAPGYPKITRSWRAYLRRIARLAHGEHPPAREVIAHARKLIQLLRRRIGRLSNRVLTDAGLPNWIPVVEDRAAANDRAGRNYVPSPYSGKIAQFMSIDEPVSASVLQDPRLAWRDFANGEFESIATPGDHDSMLAPPNVRVLGTRLRASLAAIEKDTRSAG